jgi:hypothetical protein
MHSIIASPTKKSRLWDAYTASSIRVLGSLALKGGESDNHNYIARAYTNGTVSGKAVFYLKDDGFSEVAVISNAIEIGTVNRQYHTDALGSVQATTRPLWSTYNSQQFEYWTDAWGDSNHRVGRSTRISY